MQKSIVLGGGCFWCTEAAFNNLKGITNVTSGYSGGTMPNPSYEAICTGETGHAEVIKVDFDDSVITLTDIFNVFFSVHNPTTLNRQGNDVGTQYRSIIFYTDREERDAALAFISELTKDTVFDSPIVTEVKPLDVFYPAEDYHQKYYEKNTEQGYCSAVIAPKLSKLRQKYAHLLRS
jgi:peptide-methionine (S)-S-oxide reductase